MIFLAFLLLAIIVAAISLKAVFPKIKAQNVDTWAESSFFWKALIVPAIIIVFALVNPFRLERIDAGHVGIKVNLTGDNRGVAKFEYKTGWVIYNSWFSDVYEFPTFQQHIDYEDQVVITKGGFQATIKPTFNYSLVSGNVGNMFQNLRISIAEIEKGWLKTAIVGAVNDVANKWTVDSIFNAREQFESAIGVECNKRVSQWFNVSQLRTNIIPPTAITESINAKTKAIQEVQVAENRERVAVAEANRKIAEAKGDSAQVVIAASGEAESIRRKQLSITPEYVEYLKVTRWDGKLPQVSTASAGILMNLK